VPVVFQLQLNFNLQTAPCKIYLPGYLATQMNLRNVESERYSDYFSPMPDISNDTFPKKLKPDNRKKIIGAMMQEHSVEVRF